MKLLFRYILSTCLAYFLILSGKVERARKKALNGDHILSIYFHKPHKTEFEFAVRWLKTNGFKFISLKDLKKIADEKIAFPKKSVLITVDDGWSSNIENIVKVSEKEEVPVAIFVASEAIETGNYWFNYVKRAKNQGLGFPSSEELKKKTNQERIQILELIKNKVELPREIMTIRELQQISKSPFVTIGGHTHTHPILIHCTDNEVKEELLICKVKIEGWLKKNTDSFAYPNGNFGEREMKEVENAGFVFAFANNPGFITRENIKDRYKIPRTGFMEGGSKVENICKMVGVWDSYSIKLFKNG